MARGRAQRDPFHRRVRLNVATFLFGNLRDSDLVLAAVRPQLGADATHVDHFRRFLADLASSKYDEKYHCFDVLKADWFFLSGALNARRSPPSPFARAVHAWEAECMRMRRAGPVADARRAAHVPGSVDPGSAGLRSVVQ